MSTRAIQSLRHRLTHEDATAQVATKDVRPLLSREGWYVVTTPAFAAYLSSLVVREQFDHYIRETVKWSLAMFDVRCSTGGSASRSIDSISVLVSNFIESRITADDEIELKLAMTGVLAVLEPVFGKQLRITGWMPGHRVAEGRNVLELSGDACPNCIVNPTGYRVGETNDLTHCLNSEDCGWSGPAAKRVRAAE